MDALDELCQSMSIDFTMTSSSTGSGNAVETPALHTDNVFPHMQLYKNRGRAIDQDARRRTALVAQRRERRASLIHRLRRIDPEIGDVDDREDEEVSCDDRSAVALSVDTGCEASSITDAQTSPPKPKESNEHLMLSEWLLGRSDEFDKMFLMKLCPVGRRVLVVSSNGSTRAYNKRGYLAAQFPSALPGGVGRRPDAPRDGVTPPRRQRYHATEARGGGGGDGSGPGARRHCVLDCIFDPNRRCYYVLDVVEWNGITFYDCQTDFRFYWLAQSFPEECPDALVKSRRNPCTFTPIDSYACDDASLTQVLSALPPYPVDGLLFYHSEAHYTPGVTPLVGWLKAYMAPEVLDVPVNHSGLHADYRAGMPSDYVSYREEIEKYEAVRKSLGEQIRQSNAAKAKTDKEVRKPDGNDVIAPRPPPPGPPTHLPPLRCDIAAATDAEVAAENRCDNGLGGAGGIAVPPTSPDMEYNFPVGTAGYDGEGLAVPLHNSYRAFEQHVFAGRPITTTDAADMVEGHMEAD